MKTVFKFVEPTIISFCSLFVFSACVTMLSALRDQLAHPVEWIYWSIVVLFISFVGYFMLLLNIDFWKKAVTPKSYKS